MMTCIAIQVYTGQEFITSQRIKQKLHMEAIVPAQKKLTLKAGGKTTIGFNFLYKGYLLVELQELTAQLYNDLKKVPGIIRILGKVSKDELDALKKKIYPVLEVVEKTVIEERSSRILRKTEIGNIIERIRKNKKTTLIPAMLLDKSSTYVVKIVNDLKNYEIAKKLC